MGDNCVQHLAHEEKFKQIDANQLEFSKNQSEVIRTLTEIIKQLTVVQESTKSAHHRIDSQEEQTRAIYELAFEVKGFGEKQSEILKLLTNHDGRIELIEKNPGQTALKAWQWFIVAVAGGFIGMFFAIGADIIQK